MLDIATPAGVTLEDDGGRWKVLDAPPVAEFTCLLLSQPNQNLIVNEAGDLVVAGQVTYRPVRLRQHLSGQCLIVCERVT